MTRKEICSRRIEGKMDRGTEVTREEEEDVGHKYSKFSNKGTPMFFLTLSGSLFTLLPISQLIIIGFSFRKMPLKGANVWKQPLRACYSSRCVYERIYSILVIDGRSGPLYG